MILNGATSKQIKHILSGVLSVGNALKLDGKGANAYRKVCVVVEDAEADFNNYTEDGVYYFGTSTTLINAPNGAVSGWLDVTHLEGASSLIQRWQERTDATFSSTRTKSSATTWRPWYGFNDDHNIKTYTSLSQIGLNNESFPTNDFATNVTTLMNALPSRSMYISMLTYSDYPNLVSSLITKLNSDVGASHGTSNSFNVIITKPYTSNSCAEIKVMLDTTSGRNRIYTCIFDTSSGTVHISKFAESYNAEGFLPLSGGEMNGDITLRTTEQATRSIAFINAIRHGNINVFSDGSLGFYDNTNKKWILQSTLDGTLLVDGGKTPLHTGNKPTGNYTGNGSATERKINIGGIGGILYLYNRTNGYGVLAYSNGFLVINGSTVTALPSSHGEFWNGLLTIKSTNEAINNSGSTIDYWLL